MDLSKKALEDVFQVARNVKAGHTTLAKGSSDLEHIHRININSARIMIRSLCHMLNGERYRRALPIEATDYFLGRINEEDGSAGLKAALEALSAHIDYRHSTGVNVPGLADVFAKHSK